MVCLDTTRTAALVAGALPAAERRVAEGHLASCDRCRLLVSEVVRDPSHLGRPTELGFAGSGDRAARSPRAGNRVGRFLLRGVLGTGGMGVVYDAYDEQLLRAVALKQLRPRPHGDETTAAGDQIWISEARALARLHHPNVVTLYEVVPHAGMHFLALERVDGVTLRGWLRARRRTTDEILEVFLAAAYGLEAAHAAGIVHRDFKPDNVLVGRDGRVRVADFGLAMSMAVREPVVAGGTPRYVAPEQARGEPPDARCDQYSFAVALLEALSGATAAATLTTGGDPVPWDPRPADAPLGGHPAGAGGRTRRAIPQPLDPDRRPHPRPPPASRAAAARDRGRGGQRAGGGDRQRRLARPPGDHAQPAAARAGPRGGGLQGPGGGRPAAGHAAMADEAASLRTRQAENAEEAAALRAQIASLVGELAVAESTHAEARALRRVLQQRNTQLRVLARALASSDRGPEPVGKSPPRWRDDSPHPLVVERHVRRLSRPLQACLTEPDGLLRLPPDLGASLLITAAGITARADVTGVEDAERRVCVARVLASLRIPSFDSPAVRAYVISLSWLGLEARIRVVE